MRVLIDYTARVAGGGLTHISNLVPSLCRQGVDAYLLKLKSKKIDLRHSDNLTIIDIDDHGLPHLPWKFKFQQVDLKHWAKKLSVDVVYCPTDTAPIYDIGYPVVLSIRNPDPWDASVWSTTRSKFKNFLLRWNTAFSSRSATVLHFVSRASIEYFRERGLNVNPSKCRVVHHGVSNAFFEVKPHHEMETFLQKIGLWGVKYILFVGNFLRHKNLITLFKALKLTLKELPSLYLVMVGSPKHRDYWSEMQSYIESHRLKEKVIFLGNLDYFSLHALYQGARLFVFPSTHETFGMPMLEAMTSRIPLIVSDLPFAHEVCGDVPIYFDPMNHEDLAFKIMTLLRDSDLRHDMAIRGYERAKRFTWENTGKRMAKIFEEAVEMRSTLRRRKK